MRLLVPLALAALLVATPLAAAGHGGKLPHLDTGAVPAGPCTAYWSLYWPGNLVALQCVHGGAEAVFVALGTGAIGWRCAARVAGTTVLTCDIPPIAIDDVVLP